MTREELEEVFDGVLDKAISMSEEKEIYDGMAILSIDDQQMMLRQFDFNMFNLTLNIENSEILKKSKNGMSKEDVVDAMRKLMMGLAGLDESEEEKSHNDPDISFIEKNLNMPKKELENLYKLFLEHKYPNYCVALYKDSKIVFKYVPDKEDKKIVISSELFNKPINYN